MSVSLVTAGVSMRMAFSLAPGTGEARFDSVEI
jgi:hypothetical protein